MKGKKLLAGILSAAMVLSTTTFIAFAETTVMPDAADGVITLDDNVTLSSYGITSDLVLDLKGHTLDASVEINIPTGGNVTIKDGTITSAASAVLHQKSKTKLTLDNVKIIGKDKTDAKGTRGVYIENSNGVNISNSYIKAGNVTAVAVPAGNNFVPTEALYIIGTASDEIVISGSTIVAADYNYGGEDELVYNSETRYYFQPCQPALYCSASKAKLTVRNSEIHGGNNNLRDASTALYFASTGGTLMVEDSKLYGGSSSSNVANYGFGGQAIEMGGTPASVSVSGSTLVGGNGAYSWAGTGISNRAEKLTVSNSTVKAGEKGKLSSSYGLAIGTRESDIELDNVELIANGQDGAKAINVSLVSFLPITVKNELKITGNDMGNILLVCEDNAKVLQRSDETGTYAENTERCVEAQIGGTYYSTLAEAVESAEADDTVKLLCNTSGDGIVIAKNLTIDFNGFSYTVNGTLVGSPKSETNCFQLLAGADSANPANITLKNGKIISSKLAKWGPTTDNDEKNPKHSTGANIIVQNYSNLTLDNMTIDGDQTDENGGNPSVNYGKYVLSNNNGHTVLTGDTNIIAAPGKYAFDVYGGWYPAYPAVSVTLDEKMTGTITGNIQVSNGDPAEPENFSLSIKNGTLNGEIKDDRSAVQKENYPKLEVISGGTFSTDASKFCVDGFTLVKDETTGLYNTKKVLRWETDTDSGSYVLGDKKYGMMRFMFKTAPEGEVTASGIKYINASDIAAVPTVDGAVNTTNHSSVFQGDIVKVPENKTGTYYAKAYVTTAEGTFWSEAVGCSVNWDRFFADYKEGQE